MIFSNESSFFTHTHDSNIYDQRFDSMINDLLSYEKCPSFLQLHAHHDISKRKNDRFDAIQQFFRFKGRAFSIT